jgi:hypothetical protein
LGLIQSKFKEVIYSVLPITLLVVILHFTLTPIEPNMLFRFLIGAALIIIGLTVFLSGVDIGITPIGNMMGGSLAKSSKIWIVVAVGLLLGFFISVAEPDLHILAGQVDAVTSGQITKLSIVMVVSIGIAVMISFGLSRIVFNIPLRIALVVIYGIILVICIFVSPEFLAISFDASGATTGALTVPFILALAAGVSKLKKDSAYSENDSFGLVGVASSGAILGVALMSVISRAERMTGSLPVNEVANDSLLGPFFRIIPTLAGEVLLALAPMLVIFLVFNAVSLKVSRDSMRKILFGFLFAFIGLVLFLLGVNAGFMEVGGVVGYRLAAMDSSFWVILIGFILGMVTILAEPAVHILNQQIEDVTSGYVKKKAVMAFLAIGVALAVALSIVRIIRPGVQLWHYLLPGYIISVAMSFVAPQLFVGIAFDSGGVASGPMTATFILAYAQGAAEAIEGANVLVDGFGIIAMVAMTPLIALQVLGLIFKIKSKKEGVAEDD